MLVLRPPPLHVLTFFFFNDTATTEIYTLSLHDALPICSGRSRKSSEVTNSMTKPCRSMVSSCTRSRSFSDKAERSEEHTSELQSQSNLVCRLLLEKKKKQKHTI